jgi:hypothetical protein
MPLKFSDEEVIDAWRRGGGSPTGAARILGANVVALMARRARMAKRGIVLPTASASNNQNGTNGFGRHDWQVKAVPYENRASETLRDGYMVIFSDAHFWPGIRSVAFEALLKVVATLRPKLLISNGDAFDGASISRHDPLGWQTLPTVIEELDATKNFLDEIARAAPTAKRRFVVGNHDSRFDRRLATETQDFKGVKGFRLSDHLKGWPMSYAVLVNEETDPAFVVHSIRGGMYAPRNNVLAAGCTVFTGHLHSQKTIPVSTLLDDWEGVDSGTLADRDGPQFSYVSSRPTDWREGFAVERYDRNGYRYPVELCRVQHVKGEARAVFRGEVVYSRKERAAA